MATAAVPDWCTWIACPLPRTRTWTAPAAAVTGSARLSSAGRASTQISGVFLAPEKDVECTTDIITKYQGKRLDSV